MLQMELKFSTNYQFIDRKTKAKYVWLKYQNILNGRILDVGADECYLKGYLEEGTSYVGIGLGGDLDKKVDLEKEKIPFADNSFDCIICNDVLEHLDNIHGVFDELCRVTRRWVIISLPSPWQDFYSMLRNGYYDKDRPMKFYNLPLEPPEDRHKWFFSTEEAGKFIEYRAVKNGMSVVQMDIQGHGGEGGGLIGLMRRLFVRILFSNSVSLSNLYTGTLWAVLEKRSK